MSIALFSQRERRPGNNRRNKHNEDLVMLGTMVRPEFKAVALYTATILNISLTELLLNGIISEGTRAGVLENGKVKPELEDAIQTIADVFRENLRLSREKSSSKESKK